MVEFYCLNDYPDWPCLGQVCCMGRAGTRKGVTGGETTCAVTSLGPAKADAQGLQGIWRGHWGTEDRNH
ncbi:MAG TPA: hypothetical protein VFA32_19935 [Dehalococcoidia bacterium]|nr:hypothetical protein [Dehalococcoidia bacterium]